MSVFMPNANDEKEIGGIIVRYVDMPKRYLMDNSLIGIHMSGIRNSLKNLTFPHLKQVSLIVC